MQYAIIIRTVYIGVLMHLSPDAAVLSIVVIRTLTKIATNDVVADGAIVARIGIAQVSVRLDQENLRKKLNVSINQLQNYHEKT
jgi:hypothetical protein